MVNESILGALQSALARKQSLKQAMMSLYNAGYERKDIEEAAKILHYQISQNPQTQQSPAQKKLQPAFLNKNLRNKENSEKNPNKEYHETQTNTNQSSPKSQQIKASPKETNEKNQEILQKNFSNKKRPKLFRRKKRDSRKISSYGDKENFEYNQNSESQQVQRELIDALQNLKNIKIPSKIQFVNSRDPGRTQAPIINQRISGYGKPPKKVSKFATAVLVTLLVLLLGALVTIFFFKNELIQIFNNLNLT